MKTEAKLIIHCLLFPRDGKRQKTELWLRQFFCFPAVWLDGIQMHIQQGHNITYTAETREKASNRVLGSNRTFVIG